MDFGFFKEFCDEIINHKNLNYKSYHKYHKNKNHFECEFRLENKFKIYNLYIDYQLYGSDFSLFFSGDGKHHDKHILSYFYDGIKKNLLKEVPEEISTYYIDLNHPNIIPWLRNFLILIDNSLDSGAAPCGGGHGML